MWSSFKAAFAATIGVLAAYGLFKTITGIAEDPDLKDKFSDLVDDWKTSRKISHPDGHPHAE